MPRDGGAVIAPRLVAQQEGGNPPCTMLAAGILDASMRQAALGRVSREAWAAALAVAASSFCAPMMPVATASSFLVADCSAPDC